MKVFFLKTSLISALMIVVDLLFFSSIHRSFVYLRFQRTCLRCIRKKNYERLVLSVCFVSFVLNVMAFVYSELKQSLTLFGKN